MWQYVRGADMYAMLESKSVPITLEVEHGGEDVKKILCMAETCWRVRWLCHFDDVRDQDFSYLLS